VVEARGGALNREPGIDDTTVVGLEVASVQGDGEGTVLVQVLSHGDLRGSSLGAGDASVTSDGGSEVVGRVLVGEGNLALASLSGVRIRSLRDDSSPLLDVLHTVPLETTVATLVADRLALDHGAIVRAVNKELLRQDLLRETLNQEGSLEVTDGGEGPARTALTLILNGGDLTLLNPIPGSRGVSLGESLEVQSGTSVQASSGQSLRGLRDHLVGASKLLLRDVGELVQVERSLGVRLAVGIDALKGLAKVVEANALLSSRGVNLSVLGLEGFPLKNATKKFWLDLAMPVKNLMGEYRGRGASE
jgi:hypothetical protein